jgi:hypothetical protein
VPVLVATADAAGHNSRVMANMSIPRPFEPEKSGYIHDRATRPDAPKPSRLELAQRWVPFAAALALGVGSTALLFSIRDSWENHREWLVTVIPVLVIAAIALAHLITRKQLIPLAPGGAFLFLALVFAGADILVDREPNPSSTTQDWLSILAGVSLGIAVALLAFSLLWVEIREPTKAPTPEL